jgi:hypothetical protein
MPRGGHNKPTWKAGKTTVIRIPEAKKDEILSLVRALDKLDWDKESYRILDKATYDGVCSLLSKLCKTYRGKYKEDLERVLSLLSSQ